MSFSVSSVDMNNKHMPALDGLRGIAALIVVVSHYSNETNLWGGFLGSGAGQAGVILFFILSGFLITKLHIDQQFNLKNCGAYAIRRIARVYPYFVIVAALPAFLVWVGFPGKIGMVEIDSFPKYLRQILLIERGANVFWTIQVEILFYASFIFIWLLARAAVNSIVVFLMVSLVVGLSLLLKPKTGFLFFDSAHIFLIGVLSAIVYKWLPQRISGLAWSVAGLSLLLSVPLTFPVIYKSLTGIEIDPWLSVLVLAQLAALFNLALRGSGLLGSLLSSKVLVWLGKISFSIYLLHYFVLVGFLSLVGPVTNHALYFLCVMSLIIPISWIGYKYVEMPVQRLVLSMPTAVSRLFSIRASKVI